MFFKDVTITRSSKSKTVTLHDKNDKMIMGRIYSGPKRLTKIRTKIQHSSMYIHIWCSVHIALVVFPVFWFALYMATELSIYVIDFTLIWNYTWVNNTVLNSSRKLNALFPRVCTFFFKANMCISFYIHINKIYTKQIIVQKKKHIYGKTNIMCIRYIMYDVSGWLMLLLMRLHSQIKSLNKQEYTFKTVANFRCSNRV